MQMNMKNALMMKQKNNGEKRKDDKPEEAEFFCSISRMGILNVLFVRKLYQGRYFDFHKERKQKMCQFCTMFSQ